LEQAGIFSRKDRTFLHFLCQQRTSMNWLSRMFSSISNKQTISFNVPIGFVMN